MADALCGPSNALQNFQKHSSVDRTLQQDRLTNRQSPTQGFRSSPGPNAGILDSEFEAFQAGHAGPPQSNFHHPPPQFAHHPPPPQFAQAPQAPDWASDFQRLNISPPPVQRHVAPQASNASVSWHQDFMRQQAPAPQTSTYQPGMFGGMSGSSMAWGQTFQQGPGFGVTNQIPASEVARGKQPVQEGVPAFDEAAFERAFEQAQQDLLENTRVNDATESAPNHMETETDPVLLRLQEKRLPVYTTLKLRSEIDLGKTAEAQTWLQELEALESSGRLTEDASEARWVVDTLQKVANRETSEATVKTRVETLITSINERLMSTYPLLSTHVPVNQDSIWEDLEAAGYTRTPVPEQVQQYPEQERAEEKQEQTPRNDDDEMAETAGRLLERVADNTSSKFQNSQFLELMRRLRDREVRVEGDKMVETNDSMNPSASGIPGVDPNILNHAATDFNMPITSEHGDADNDQTNSVTTMSTRITTDERIPVHEQDLDLGRYGYDTGFDAGERLVASPNPISAYRGQEEPLRGR